MISQYFLLWIYLNLWLIYHLWNSDKQLMNQPVCYQQTVMSSLSRWFGGTPNRFQLDCTEWIKRQKVLLKCFSSSCLPSLIHSWTLGRAFVLFIVFMLFSDTEISVWKKNRNSISGSSIHYIEGICTLWNSSANLPTQMQVSGIELLQSVY